MLVDELLRRLSQTSSLSRQLYSQLLSLVVVVVLVHLVR